MSTKIYLDSDNLVQLTGLQNQSTDAYCNSATVTITLYDYGNRKYLDASVAVDKTGGKVGLPCAAHGFATSDYVLVVGDPKYEGRYQVDATSTTDEIVVTATYAARTFTGKEFVMKGVSNAVDIAMSYVADSNGNYQGTLADTLHLIYKHKYWAIISATDVSGNVAIFCQEWEAVFNDG